LSGLFGDDETQAQAGQPYRVLARKYRPSTLAELIGQEALVRTLTNAFQSGRLPQAWILTGVRGVGKTTTARIIAKALNCTGRNPASDSIEPCGTCEACRSIAEDRHVDVQEMDAASRTGVDDIREIIEGVRYGPVSAKYKIYILDEVHMLSKNAFNALLKTLEEPPPHTKFIFATTEIRKVPITVLSRCQRFDLRRIDSATLTAHYARIAGLEGVNAEEEAMKLIAYAADGSVRDGLSLLDQAIARANGSLTTADVKDMLGLADKAASLNLCRQILRGDMTGALASFDGLEQMGADPVQVLQDLAELIHRLTRAQIIADKESLASWPEGERQLAKDLGDIKIPALARAWQILLKGLNEVSTAPHPAAAAEMVLIRLAYAAELPPPGELIKRLREEEKAAAKAAAPESSAPPPSGGSRAQGGMAAALSLVARAEPAPAVQPAPAPAQAVALLPTSFRELVALFAEHREGGLYAQLCSYVHPVHFAPGRLEIRLTRGATQSLVTQVGSCLNEWTGKRWMISLSGEPGGPTIKEEDQAVEDARRTRAEEHPLMQAVMKAFPEAKFVSLKKKELASPVALPDETPDESSELDEPAED